MKWLIAIVTAVIAIACGAKTVEQAGIKFTRTFLPKEIEQAYRNTNDFGAVGVSESEFYAIIDKSKEILTPIFKQNGLELTINADYNDPTVNAYAERDVEQVTLHFFGGLAKNKFMNPQGFSIVVGHEAWHGLSLYPLYQNSYASSEGSSDFGAVASFARKFFAGSSGDNCSCKACGFVPEYSGKIEDYCSKFQDEERANICRLSMSGGLSLGKVLADISDEPEPSYERPDTSVIKRTMTSHPSSSCRLTQYGMAALADIEIPDSPLLSNKMRASAVLPYYAKCWFAK